MGSIVGELKSNTVMKDVKEGPKTWPLAFSVLDHRAQLVTNLVGGSQDVSLAFQLHIN